jgi:hypothetical protein
MCMLASSRDGANSGKSRCVLGLRDHREYVVRRQEMSLGPRLFIQRRGRVDPVSAGMYRGVCLFWGLQSVANRVRTPPTPLRGHVMVEDGNPDGSRLRRGDTAFKFGTCSPPPLALVEQMYACQL